MHNKLLTISNDVPNIIRDSDINIEANSNCNYLVLTNEELISIGKEGLEEFLLFVEASVHEAWEGEGVFYCWYDDMACQIRFSSVSKAHNRLPFGCKLDLKTRLSEIVDQTYLYLDEDYFNPDINTLDIYVSKSSNPCSSPLT